MKAKEILNLCEEDELNSSQIFDLIHRYLEKKMTSIGMEKAVGKSFQLRITPVDSDESYFSLRKRSKAYIKKASKVFGRLYHYADGGTVNVEFRDAKNHYWQFYPLFYLTTSVQEASVNKLFKSQSSIILTLSYSNPFWAIEARGNLSQYEDFSTEEGRQKIYRLIDNIAKFIRLTDV